MREWSKVRARLKKTFENLGITFCEICGSTFNLSFAHSKKRRFITSEAELTEVCLICIPCHQEIETLPHVEMHRKVIEIIERRVEANGGA